MKHEITAGKLMALLTSGLLFHDDVLVPNEVDNLAILRNEEYIGFINLASGEIELYEGEDQ